MANLHSLTSSIANSKGSIKGNRTDAGASIVEVAIAGVVMAMVMVAVARLSIGGIVGSSKQADRSSIEASISNNIQEIQRAETLLTYASIEAEGQAELKKACQDPASYLKTKLEDNNKTNPVYVAAPNVSDETGKALVTRSIETASVPGMAIVLYEFKGPEDSITTEKRVLELNPSFQAICAFN